MGIFGFLRPNLSALERRRDVTGLLRALKGSDEEQRKKIVEVLCRICDEKAVESLGKALQEGNWHVRAGATEALGCSEDARAGPLIASVLADERPEVRRAAVSSLARLKWEPQGASERIQYLIARGDWHGLGEMGEEASDALEEALSHPDPAVRGVAVSALGRMKGLRAYRAIRGALSEDEDPWVKFNAVLFLRGLGVEALEPLILALGEDVWEVRNSAAEGLIDIGAEAVEPLMEVLASELEYARSRAADALGEIGDPRAVEPLISLLGDEHDFVRWNTVNALGMIGDDRAVEPIIRLLRDGSVDVRKAAVEALGEIGGLTAKRALSGLAEGNGELKELAVRALAELRERVDE